VVAVVFGILALRIALYHEIELGQVSGTLDDVSVRLEGVSDSVLTRTVGVFPSFIPHVTALFAQAEKSITVMCDNPAYGIFSNGDAFDAYAAELKGKIASRTSNPSFRVDLMFLADEEREELHRDQVSLYATTAEDWENWRKGDQTHTRLEEFLKRAHSVCQPDAPTLPADEIEKTLAELTVDRYVERLAAVNKALLTHHFYGANRRVLRFRDQEGKSQARSRGPSIYFWMRDRKHAIFAIVPLGDEPDQSREVAFETHDPAMIEALRGTFSRYQRAAVDGPG